MDLLFTFILALLRTNENYAREAARGMVQRALYEDSDDSILRWLYANPWLWQFVDMEEIYIHTPSEFRSFGAIWAEAQEYATAHNHIEWLRLQEWANEITSKLENLDEISPVSQRAANLESMSWTFKLANLDGKAYVRKGCNYARRNDGRKVRTLRTHRLGCHG